MIWINRMVQRQVQKRVADLHSEILQKNNALKEEMMTELRKQLIELVANEARERPQQFTKSDREQSMRSRLLEIVEEAKSNMRADKEDEKDLLDLTTSSPYSSENPSDIDHELPREKILKVLIDILSDIETSDANDADTMTRPAKYDTHKMACLHVSSDADISSLSVRFPYHLWDDERNSGAEEEGSATDPTHANPGFTTQELRCVAEQVQVDTKEEDILLIERQWKEWMDKQEMGGNKTKVELPVDKRKSETQGATAQLPLPVAKSPTRQDAEGGGHNLTKMKTYFSDLIKSPFSIHKWQKFENEDE